MLEAGAEVVETDTFQGSRLKLEEWGLGEHTLEINTKAAEIARKAAGEDRFVAGSIGPTGFLPASTDPTLGDISFATLVEVFAEQARGLVEGGADLIIIETAQDILEVKAAIFGAREAFAADRPHAADPDQRLAPPQRRQDAARDRHPGGADDAAGARRRRDRAQLLDRARGHARRDPLPRRDQPAAGPLHPQRRPAAAGPRRRDDLPRKARAAGGDAGRVRRALRRRHRRRLLRDHARAHRRDRASGSSGQRPGRAPRPGPDRGLLDDDLDRRWCRSRARPWSASGSTRRARKRPRNCCSPTTTTASSRSPKTRSKAAPTCSTSAWR